MSEFEQQVAEALLEAMPIIEGPALQHRRRLAEVFLAPRVAAAIDGLVASHNPEAQPISRRIALATLRGE